MKERTTLIAGGDRRQVILAERLCRESRVTVLGISRELVSDPRVRVIDEIGELSEPIDRILLPMPALRDGAVPTPTTGGGRITAEEVLEVGRPGGLLLGGQIPAELTAAAEVRGMIVRDYGLREEFAVRNAVPTAEGAIRIALEALPVTLRGCRCLVVGFGRIARVLTLDLVGLGARVTVAARKPSDRAWAELFGAAAIPLPLDDRAAEPDVVFNTVPATVLTTPWLAGLRPGTPVIELASAPGGVDIEAAKGLGVRVLPAPGLPGRFTPVTAGEILCDTVRTILSETEESDWNPKNSGSPSADRSVPSRG